MLFEAPVAMALLLIFDFVLICLVVGVVVAVRCCIDKTLTINQQPY